MASSIQVSRRRFLGGSAVAFGGLTTGLLGDTLAAQPKAPPRALPLSELRAAGTLDESYWWKVRGQFNVLDGLTFMNNGTYGPTPRVVTEALGRYERELAEDPTDNYRNEGRDAVRARMAAFVGAHADEIALTRSTSEGMNIFIRGLDWKAGDEVVFCTHEHGGGIQPLQQIEARYGVKLVRVEVPSPPESVDQIVQIYERAMTAKTRLLMVSHMTYVTGLLTPIQALAELAHSKGALISVDGAHPLGMLDLNLGATGIDHYAAAGQKWLLAGTGTGVCYIKRDLQARVWPLMGYADEKAVNDPKSSSFGAKRYELGGQRNVPSFMAMAEALDFHEAVGKKNVEARVRLLSTKLRAGLKGIPGVKMWTSEDPTLSAGLTLFSVRDLPMANVVKAIYDYNRVWIRTMATGNLNGVRAATHIYNMPDEVERLLDAVTHVSQNAARYTSTAAKG
ncbi:MAG TPA: aminotransferase class V-fold PLP-dependent enzyme [Vicinamibacterales bacterium]|nr:aminotransferase class V-fold PLP-dependent enzyme [Vicinamibacterales bacterium]